MIGESIIKVRAPATSANLGAGFDTLGMALSLYNIITVKRALPPGEFKTEVTGEGTRELTDAKTNLIIKSYLDACGAWNIS